jgi:hypothetical protein
LGKVDLDEPLLFILSDSKCSARNGVPLRIQMPQTAAALHSCNFAMKAGPMLLRFNGLAPISYARQ